MKSYTLLIKLLLFSFFVNGQTLDDYIQIAKVNNPTIKVKVAAYNLENEKVNEIGKLQNTNMSLGVFALTPETRVGAQQFKVGLSQKLPWFGEFIAEKNLQKSKAKVFNYDAILSERDLIYQVKKAYYDLYQKQAMTKILDENKLILEVYEKMALAALENNKASMSDVLRIRVEKNELNSTIFQNINDIDMLSNNFNRLLQRETNQSLNITDSLNVFNILIENQTIESHPILEKLNAKNEIYKSKLKVINKKQAPEISLGLDYFSVAKRANFNDVDNGKDILMPSLSLSVPLFNFKKFDSQKKQVAIEEEMLKNSIENQKKELEIALQNAALLLNNSIIDVVAAQKNKTEIQQAINVDLKAYETGILDYDKILRLQVQKITYQLKEIKATKNAFVAKAKIDYLTQ
ncbi:MAG: TolC family protein [Flavobacteriales bacterium]